jgi:hypothetical protein
VKTVKNVWVRIAHNGRRKIAMTNFSQRVGIVRAFAAERRWIAGADTFTRPPRRRP